MDRSSTRDLTTQSSYFPKQKHAGSSSPAYIAGASDALPGEIEQTRLQCARNNFINKIDVTKAESATTESMTSKEYKDGRSSDNVPWIDEEKCAEGMVPMVRKHQRKGGNVDEEYENLSEVVNMNRLSSGRRHVRIAMRDLYWSADRSGGWSCNQRAGVGSRKRLRVGRALSVNAKKRGR